MLFTQQQIKPYLMEQAEILLRDQQVWEELSKSVSEDIYSLSGLKRELTEEEAPDWVASVAGPIINLRLLQRMKNLSSELISLINSNYQDAVERCKAQQLIPRSNSSTGTIKDLY